MPGRDARPDVVAIAAFVSGSVAGMTAWTGFHAVLPRARRPASWTLDYVGKPLKKRLEFCRTGILLRGGGRAARGSVDQPLGRELDGHGRADRQFALQVESCAMG